MNCEQSEKQTRITRDTRGTSALEFALVGGLVVAFLFGTIDFARMLWEYNQLQYVVEQSARYAVIQGGQGTSCSQSAVINHAENLIVGLTIPSADFTTNCSSTTPTCASPSGTTTNGYTVSVTVPFVFTSKAFSNISLNASYCRPLL